MTIQEIFDKVTTHLLTQGKQSKVEDEPLCLYRGPDGAMCAVGCLIKDEFYDKSLEQNLSTDRIIHDALEKSGIEVTEGLEKFLRTLQKMHDGQHIKINETEFRSFTPSQWAEGLQYIATMYNLKFNPTTTNL
jgi:hypothetical protein